MAAALIVVSAAQLLLGALVASVMIGVDTPAAGSLALGASLACVGLVFAGLAAVAAQISQTTSSMYGLTGAAIGAAYLLRAAGDVGDGTLSWLSPIGWGQSMRPYAGERWWPLSALARRRLRARRRGGRAARAPRRGRRDPRRAPRARERAAGASRARSGSRCGCSAACCWAGRRGCSSAASRSASPAATPRASSATATQIEDLLGSGAGDIVDQYFAVSMLTMALIGAGFGIQVALRMRGEETSGRLEPLLATALSRARWTGAYVAVAMGGSMLVLAANGLGAGIADAINGDDAGQLPRLLLAGVVPAPAVWVVVGAAVALFGLVPRAAVAAWGVLGACALLVVLGPLLGLPQWMLDLSPFEHVPQLPAADFSAAPLLALSAVAAALTAVGMLAFRRRDLMP